VQVLVEEVGRDDVGEGVEEVPLHRGVLGAELGEEGLHPAPAQVRLGAAQVAGHHREPHLRGEGGDVLLRGVAERPHHHVAPVLRPELRGHGLEGAGVERGEEQRLHEIVAVVAEGDLRAAHLDGRAVEHAAAQPGADRAGRLALRHEAADDRVGVPRDHPVGHPHRPEVPLEDVRGEPGLPLVEVHRDEVEVDGRALAQPHQDVEEGVAVLAPRHGDHDAVALLDEGEVLDRLRGGAEDPLLETADLVHARR
jgi:hypothetical protein